MHPETPVAGHPGHELQILNADDAVTADRDLDVVELVTEEVEYLVAIVGRQGLDLLALALPSVEQGLEIGVRHGTSPRARARAGAPRRRTDPRSGGARPRGERW